MRGDCEGGSGFDPGRAGEEDAADEAAIDIIGDVFTPSLAPHADIVCFTLWCWSICPSLWTCFRLSVKPMLHVPPGWCSPRCRTAPSCSMSSVSRIRSTSIRPTSRRHRFGGALQLAGLAPARVDAVFGNQFLVAEATYLASGRGAAGVPIAGHAQLRGLRRPVHGGHTGLAGLAGSRPMGGPARRALGRRSQGRHLP